MSNCNECIEINPIPTCSDNWQITAGVDSVFEDSELIFRITNISTSGVISGTTDPVASDGTVTIDVSEILPELMDHTYKLELFQGDFEPIEITIGEETGCCVEFRTTPYTIDTVIFNNYECNA